MSPFHQILGNNLIANVTNFTVWFALTFWVYIETQSVFATGMIAGVYLVFTAAFGFWFGSIVDHNPKKLAMMGSSVVSAFFYTLSLAMVFLEPEGAFANPYGWYLWAFVFLIMLGVIAGNIRSIALPTLVTILIPEDRRDKANGLVGMVSGIGFLTTSVISGFLVAWGGMLATLILALVLTLMTEVVKNPMPLTMPTRPLALSRRSSGMRIVTRVGRAMERILPAMTPTMTRTMNPHSQGAPTCFIAPSGATASRASDAA